MEIYDAIVVGGGPAGSTCARFLVRGGARVVVVDRAEFPRVKLCGGWLSAPIWDALAMSPGEYRGGLWDWRTCHVHFGGVARAIPCRGWFIRRFEFDDFLLRGSGAELALGTSVRDIERDGDGLYVVAGRRARHLVGAGGTYCPVARAFEPPRPRGPVAAQEHEFRGDEAAIARTRAGLDGEPELLLHDDLEGYSWNVPKTGWLNVGSGTVNPGDVREAWQAARAHFLAAGHLPPESAAELDAMKGHAYYLFDPAHLDGAARVDQGGKTGTKTGDKTGDKTGVYLIGDSLGLAQPLTAEGILPAVISGRVCAEAILAGEPAAYPARLRAHPVLADYRRIFRARELAANALARRPGRGARRPSAVTRRAVAAGFAWLFSGARLPAPGLVDLLLAGADRWNGWRSGARGGN